MSLVLSRRLASGKLLLWFILSFLRAALHIYISALRTFLEDRFTVQKIKFHKKDFITEVSLFVLCVGCCSFKRYLNKLAGWFQSYCWIICERSCELGFLPSYTSYIHIYIVTLCGLMKDHMFLSPHSLHVDVKRIF